MAQKRKPATKEGSGQLSNGNNMGKKEAWRENHKANVLSKVSLLMLSKRSRCQPGKATQEMEKIFHAEGAVSSNGQR